MAEKPLVSVIIPNYNHAPYLDQRISSVLAQTYSNMEVIILDDKSPDNSVEVIEKYRNDPKVSHIVVNKENSGSTFLQWNKGLALAKGEIIWIAESDDYCSPDFLESCVTEFMRMTDCAVVYCSSEYVDSEGNDLGTFRRYDQSLYRMDGREFIRERMAFGCDIWNASSAIFSKKLALTLSGDYQDFKACGDKLFWIYMAEKGNVVHVNSIMNYFRQHQNKVSPKRLRDGTALKEERLIYKYQCSNGYLSGIKKIFVLNLYLNKIRSISFDDDEVKENVIRFWKMENRGKRFLISLISRVYTYYCLYLRHRKPI